MSGSNFLQDGTGKGFRAKVDNGNRLRVFSIGATLYERQAEEGKAFNINTELLSISSTAETPLLYVTSDEPTDIEIVGWFIGTDFGTVGANQGLMRVYQSPTGVTGGTTVPVVNRRAGDPTVFDLTALHTPTWTPSGTPVLYQTHSLPQRVFGTVNLFLPRGAGLIVTCEFSTATTPFSIYTGFTGYIAEGV